MINRSGASLSESNAERVYLSADAESISDEQTVTHYAVLFFVISSLTTRLPSGNGLLIREIGFRNRLSISNLFSIAFG